MMVAGWPIAHHVWAGNRIDHSTVQEVIADLRKRFEFGRLVFVGDRGMVTEENLESLTTRRARVPRRGQAAAQSPRSTVGSTPLTRRKWVDLSRSASIPGNGRPTRRAPVPRKSLRAIRGCGSSSSTPTSGAATSRPSGNRRWSEPASSFEKLKERVTSGQAEAAREDRGGRRADHAEVSRLSLFRLGSCTDGDAGVLRERRSGSGREKKIEGKYVIMTSEKDLSILRRGGDVQGTDRGRERVSPAQGRAGDAAICIRWNTRVKAHIFVAAYTLSVQRFLEQRLQGMGADLSPEHTTQALSTVRVVTPSGWQASPFAAG